MTTANDPPIACTLGADDLTIRQESWFAVMAAALRSKTATPTGIRLEFDPDPEAAHTLLDLVASERSCCAWASWSLTNTQHSTSVEVDADESGVPVIHAMFEQTPDDRRSVRPGR